LRDVITCMPPRDLKPTPICITGYVQALLGAMNCDAAVQSITDKYM